MSSSATAPSTSSATTRPRPSAAWRCWPTFVDGAVDGAVVAFALWTLWYQVAMLAQVDLRPSGWPFAVVAIALMVLCGLRSTRSTRSGREAVREVVRGAGAEPARQPPRAVLSGTRRAALLLGGLALLLVAVLERSRLGVPVVAVVAILLILAVVAPSILGRVAEPAPEELPAPRQAEHVAAGLVALATGVLSLFVFKSDADDAYYVNRAAWVAEHGTAQLHDTMFGPGTFPLSFGGGLPTPSIEALQGVMAAMLHVEAGTVAYLVYAPVLSAIFVWVTWRLVREWAPRRFLLVLLVALVFVLASGASVIGNYSIGRIWQGKVTAFAVLVPLVWTYFSRLLTTRSRDLLALLLAAGITFVGLTTSSALLTPMIAGSALLAALALRSRLLALGALAFMVAPIVNGVVQMFGSSTLGEQLLSVTSPDSVFGIAFGGITAMAALALIGTVAAVAIARRPAGILAAAVGVLTLAMFLPGMLSLAASVTGAGAVVWRLPIVAPTGVLVGLLAAAPVERWSTRFGGVAARAGMAAVALVVAVVVAVPVLSGRWQWSTEVGAKLTSSPTWKVDPVALADVRAARRLHVAPGLWLMPRVQMENLAISTAGPYAVVPRIAYLPALDESKQQLRDRRVLFVLARGAPLTLPSVADVRGALRRLDVALACVPGDAPGARRLLSQAVGGHLQRVGSMECHVAAP